MHLHADDDLETSYAARKKSTRKKVAKRKSTKETSKRGEEVGMYIHAFSLLYCIAGFYSKEFNLANQHKC